MGTHNSEHKCPHCGAEIEEIFYTKWGQKVWNGKEWEDDKSPKNSEHRASCCNGSLSGDDLCQMGVI